VVLMFIGAKMLLPERYELPTWVALAVVASVLVTSVLLSVVFPKKDGPNSEERQA
jgi:tellurite resistance protein TerC